MDGDVLVLLTLRLYAMYHRDRTVLMTGILLLIPRLALDIMVSLSIDTMVFRLYSLLINIEPSNTLV